MASIGSLCAPSAPQHYVIGSTLLVAGELSRANGLGEGARLMLQALKNLNIPSDYLEISPYFFSYKHYQRNAKILSDNPYAPIIFHINSPQIPFALLSLPQKHLKNRLLIGYWAWELPILPKIWKFGFHHIHEIWTPSYFSANAMESLAANYKKTVRIVPHPVAEKYVSLSHKKKIKELEGLEKKIIILSSINLSSSFARKNPIGVIKAFKYAKLDSEKVFLILKLTEVGAYQDNFETIKKEIHPNTNIIIITRTLSNDEYQSLLDRADIVLSLHRSEGFGLIVAEGMLYGKPVISTNWSATSEFLDAHCGIPIHYQLIPVLDERKVYQVKNAYWADPDLKEAANKLNKLVEDSSYRHSLGMSAYQKAQKQFTSRKLIFALKNISFKFTSKQL